jgi:hypothetical protein
MRTTMSLWIVIGVVALAGALGGFVNALTTSDKTLGFPHKQVIDGQTVWNLGSVGNVILGMAAASISWGLYGPYSSELIVGEAVGSPIIYGLNVASFFGAFLVGIAGTRWISGELDKDLGVKAIQKAAEATPNANLRSALKNISSPKEGLVVLAQQLSP